MQVYLCEKEPCLFVGFPVGLSGHRWCLRFFSGGSDGFNCHCYLSSGHSVAIFKLVLSGCRCLLWGVLRSSGGFVWCPLVASFFSTVVNQVSVLLLIKYVFLVVYVLNCYGVL